VTTSEVGIVKAWHETLNDGDIDRLVALSHLYVEVGGACRIGRGVQLLCE
jgi:hypothetical protein